MTATTPASQFVYVTYIRSTPETVWDALTSADLMTAFGMRQESDWKIGSGWRLKMADGRIADSGEVLEIEHPKRLALNWRNEWDSEMQAEGDGHCLYEIEAVDGAVKLTVTHGLDKPDSKYVEGVSRGWPMILSNLKSELESQSPASRAAA